MDTTASQHLIDEITEETAQWLAEFRDHVGEEVFQRVLQKLQGMQEVDPTQVAVLRAIVQEEVQKLIEEKARELVQKKVGQGEEKPDIADVFHDGVAAVLTALPLQVYPAAVIADKKNAWKEVESMGEHEVIIAFAQRENSGITSVQLRADATGLDRKMVLDSLFAQVDRFSDLHSDHFWAMIAQLQGGQRDEAGNTWITAHKLLDYRGIKRVQDTRTHGHRPDDLRRTSEIIRSMENVWIKLDEVEIMEKDAIDKKLRRSRISHESRLFMFGDIIYHQELSLDGTPGKRYPIAWQYRESNWMLPFLEGPYRFTGTLLSRTLNYDPSREFWEKRLAKYFMVYLRINAGRYRPIKIQELFTRLNLPINHDRNKHRTRDRFEKAMNTMVEHGHIHSWRCKEDVNQLSAHNWLTNWLNYHIIVTPPAALQEQYQLIATRAAALREQQASSRKRR